MSKLNLLAWMNKRVEFADVVKHEPEEEVKEGEVVISTLSPEVQKIVAANLQYQEEVSLAIQELIEEREMDNIFGRILDEDDEGHDSRTCPGCIRDRKYNLLVLKRKFFNEFSWAAVRDEIGDEGILVQIENDTDSVSLRKGWKVVTIPKAESAPPLILDVTSEFLGLLSTLD